MLSMQLQVELGNPIRVGQVVVDGGAGQAMGALVRTVNTNPVQFRSDTPPAFVTAMANTCQPETAIS